MYALTNQAGGSKSPPFEFAAKRLAIDHICQQGAKKNGRVIEWAYTDPPVRLNPPTLGVENPLFKLQLNGWRSTKMSIEHVL